MARSMYYLTLALFAAEYVAMVSATICYQYPYSALLSLSTYSVAELYCSSYRPQPVVTVTVTAKIAARFNVEARVAATTTKATTTSAKPSATSMVPVTTSKPASTMSTTTKSTCTGDCARWSSVLGEGAVFISTVCSCIEKARTTTVTVTPLPTATDCNQITNPYTAPNGNHFELSCGASLSIVPGYPPEGAVLTAFALPNYRACVDACATYPFSDPEDACEVLAYQTGSCTLGASIGQVVGSETSAWGWAFAA